ncbi:MAG: hypothetical protein PHS41_07800, partial [Victivallaceae bacterium]|nr:hypothetical protein [Victivallaceae bacterium]
MNLKKQICLLILAAGMSLPLGAVPLDMKSTLGAPFAKDGQQAENLRRGEKDVIRLSWDGGKRKWAEFFWRKAFAPLNYFESVRVTVTCEAGGKMRPTGLNLRFIDKDGEIFQFPGKLSFAPDGTAKVSCQFRYDAPARNSWKANANAVKNGKIDLPIRFLGVSVEYPNGSGEGELILRSIDVETVA